MLIILIHSLFDLSSVIVLGLFRNSCVYCISEQKSVFLCVMILNLYDLQNRMLEMGIPCEVRTYVQKAQAYHIYLKSQRVVDVKSVTL